VAPCCGQAFGCRHCHNDAKVRWFPSFRFRFGSGSADVLKQPCPVPRQNSLEVDPRDRHEIPRHEIKKVSVPSLCSKSNLLPVSTIAYLVFVFVITVSKERKKQTRAPPSLFSFSM
jgi:hypothetical protein